MNAMGRMQSKWCPSGVMLSNPLHSYLDECQKNEIRILHLHYLGNVFHLLHFNENKLSKTIILEVLPAVFG